MAEPMMPVPMKPIRLIADKLPASFQAASISRAHVDFNIKPSSTSAKKNDRLRSNLYISGAVFSL